jgi:hypothetical protein
MEAEDGTYLISAKSDKIFIVGTSRSANAKAVAYVEAQTFCANKGAQMLLTNGNEPDVNQSAGGTSVNSSNGAVAGGTTDAGISNLRFRCEKTNPLIPFAG